MFVAHHQRTHSGGSMKKFLMFASLSFAYTLVSGCGGSDTIVKNEETCGKQLTDLKTALDSGAMTQKEYDRAREKAIKNCNH
jgi:hypothetical protein